MVATKVVNLTGDLAIQQGSKFSMLIRYPGNIVDGGVTFAGQLRTRPGGKLLTSFQFATPVYNASIGKTEILATIPAASTSAITDGILHGSYDIEMTVEGYGTVRLFPGKFEIDPEVTV